MIMADYNANKQKYKRKKMIVCPYYQTEYKQCNFFGTYQEGYQKEHYCLSSDDWRHCANYEKRSLDEKVSKRLRPNPDL